jgi:NSS family neurotransmitter:Na+ symporter
MMFDNIRQNLAKNYEDYPTSLIVIAGVVVAAVVILVAVLLSLKGWKANAHSEEKKGVA